MPGMWVLETLEGCDAISKPSVETFISSKEAIAAFEWSIGFSGTFSAAVKGIISDLKFDNGGTAASAVRVGITTALVRDQADILTAITETRDVLAGKGVASVDLIVTPNFDMTTSFVESLKEKFAQEIRQENKGISEEDLEKAVNAKMAQVVSLSLDSLNDQIRTIYEESLGQNGKYRSDVANAIGMQEGVNIDSILSSRSEQEKLAIMTELLKLKAKAGLATYIIGDVDLLGRGWNLGDMKNAIESIKQTSSNASGKEVTQTKVQATLWAVNFEQMDGTQYEQLLGRIDHRGGKSRFSEDYYHRDIVQITSVESARENKVVREAVNKTEGKLYSTDIILENLSEIQLKNEENKLAKAGNATATTTRSNSSQQETLTYGQARESLTQQLGSADQAQQVIDMLNKSGVSEGTAMSDTSYSKYENYVNYVAAARGFGIEDLTLSAQDFDKVVAGKASDILTVLKQKKGNTTEFDSLISEIEWLEENYGKEQQKINDVYQNMTKEQQEVADKMSRGEKLSIKEMLSVAGMRQASKDLQKHMRAFDRINDSLFRQAFATRENYFGFEINETDGSVTFANADREGIDFIDQIRTIAEENGDSKLGSAIKRLSAKDIQAVLAAPNKSDKLLSTLHYLGYDKKIGRAIDSLADTKKGDDDVVSMSQHLAQEGDVQQQQKLIRYFATKKAQDQVMASIGTAEQEVNIPAEDANVIREILNIETKASQPQTAQTETTDVVSQQETSVVGNCIDVSVEALKTLGAPIRDLSNFAVKVYAQDELLAAGSSSELADELFKARAKTGFVYAVVEEGTTELETPFIAYMQKDGDTVGHTVTVTSYKGNEVKYIDGEETKTKSVDEFKSEGFTGLVLAQKGTDGLSYLDSGVNNAVEEMFKAVRSRKYDDGKEMLAAIINGVMAPEELNKALDYVLAIWGKDSGEMLKYIGLDSSALGNKEAIIQGATRKITEAIELGKKGELQPAEVKVEIELITTLRDLLIVAGQQDGNWLQTADVNEVRAKLVVSKAVNQNIIANMFVKGIKGSVTNASSDDFVIDVKKLQSTIVDKNIKFAKNAKIEEVMDVLKDRGSNRFRTPLMRLADIHAIAASA